MLNANETRPARGRPRNDGSASTAEERAARERLENMANTDRAQVEVAARFLTRVYGAPLVVGGDAEAVRAAVRDAKRIAGSKSRPPSYAACIVIACTRHNADPVRAAKTIREMRGAE